MKKPVKKIALIGPESTAKTMLSIELAEHFNTMWVPEFSRDYISTLNRKYTLDDIQYCTKAQLRSEEEKLLAAENFLFCDTELIVAKVWCEDVFKTVPPWIEKMIDDHRYDLFLLTTPDISFQPDSVRENPHRREFFYNRYKDEIEKRNFSYEIIEGKGDLRLSNALNAIAKHFPEKLKHVPKR